MGESFHLLPHTATWGVSYDQHEVTPIVQRVWNAPGPGDWTHIMFCEYQGSSRTVTRGCMSLCSLLWGPLHCGPCSCVMQYKQGRNGAHLAFFWSTRISGGGTLQLITHTCSWPQGSQACMSIMRSGCQGPVPPILVAEPAPLSGP